MDPGMVNWLVVLIVVVDNAGEGRLIDKLQKNRDNRRVDRDIDWICNDLMDCSINAAKSFGGEREREKEKRCRSTKDSGSECREEGIW